MNGELYNFKFYEGFMSKMDVEYFKMLNLLIESGRKREDRTGTGTLSIFGYQYRINIPIDGFPILTTKAIKYNNVFEELMWFLSGSTNSKDLEKKGVNIWKEWSIEDGSLGPVYSAPFTRWEISTDELLLVEKRNPVKSGERVIPDSAYRDNSTPVLIPPLDSTYYFNYGEPFEVIGLAEKKKNSNKRVLVRFLSTGTVTSAAINNIKSNLFKIRNVYALDVFDVGCTGNVKHKRAERKVYDLWYNILSRCYSVDNAHFHEYGGKGVFVSPEWLCLETFSRDIKQLVNYSKWVKSPFEYQLDKDYYGSNCYSLQTCIFLERKYNIKLSKNLSPMTAISPNGASHIFDSVKDMVSFLGVSDETFRNYEKGIYKNPKLKGWVIKKYEPPENSLLRKKQFINQFEQLVEGLIKRPYSRRHILSAWNVADLPDESKSPQENVKYGKMALAPCHVLYQFYCRPELDGKMYIDCMMTQRSADVFLGLPYNICSVATLLYVLSMTTGYTPGEVIHSIGDLHLYSNHIEQAKLQLTREPRPAPKFMLTAEEGKNGAPILDWKLIGYNPHPPIKALVSV